MSWETESIESYVGGDLTDETVLQSMAARLDFVRSRIVYLKEAFKNHTITENFAVCILWSCHQELLNFLLIFPDS